MRNPSIYQFKGVGLGVQQLWSPESAAVVQFLTFNCATVTFCIVDQHRRE